LAYIKLEDEQSL